VQHLSLSRETSQRAEKCGFNVVNLANSCLRTITHNVNGNSYEDIAKIVDVFADVALLFLKKYQTKDIEVARFHSSDSQEFSVYLSNAHSGYILVKEDESVEPSVRVTNGNEIWRYLDEPIHVIETVISVIVAYAEKHKSVKEKWLFSLEDIEEISGEQKYDL
jgi:hypothetical protein